MTAPRASLASRPPRRPLWIDLDNAPHVVFFAPIVRALAERGRKVVLTARDVNDTPALAARYGLAPEVSGRAYGAGRAGKIAGTLGHALRLALRVRARRPALAVSHGSRAQAIAARLLRIPVALFFDYENADLSAFRLSDTRYFFPERLACELGPMEYIRPERRFPYPGLKEHLALLSRQGDAGPLRAAGLPADRPYAVIRPESDTAHYLGDHHDRALVAALERCRAWDLVPIVVPRSDAQRQRLAPLIASHPPAVMLKGAVNGIDLLLGAKLLVSGGGTMNREAVVLGLPCISIFRGATGALDRAFIREGRMIHAPDPERLAAMESLPVPPPAESAVRAAETLRDWIVERLDES